MPPNPKPAGVIERIKAAQSPEEVEKLAGHAVGFKKSNPKALMLINRAAVKRNEELSKP